MIKSVIRKITHLLGFTIVKIPKESETVFTDFDKPLYIEFIGISGVGKTTLFQKLDNTKRWITISNFIKKHKLNRNDANHDNDLVYQNLAELKIQSIVKEDFYPFDKLKLFNYYYSVLNKDILISLNNKQSTILSEEGLFHNFSDPILDLLKYNTHEYFYNLIKNRAIVYCYSSPEAVANQLIKRKEITGKLLPQHKVESFEELVDLQKAALLNKENFVNTIKKYDIPVLSINTAEDLNENVQKINRFLSELQNSNRN